MLIMRKPRFSDRQLTDLLYKTNGDIAECAKILGVAKSTIYSKIQRTKDVELTHSYEETQKRKLDNANLLNKQFGCRVVIAKGSRSSQGHQFWICECKCGDIKEIPGSYLLNGRSHKCLNCSTLKHGMKGTPEYYAWCNMVQRCCNPNHPEYSNYGGRGISICEEYRSNFLCFLNDIGIRQDVKFSLGRIDNEKGYETGNIQWETPEIQTNNRRVTLQVEGKKVSCISLSKELGIDRETIRKMIKLGCSMNELKVYPSLDWNEKRAFFKEKKRLN
jgi:hypothetical protein